MEYLIEEQIAIWTGSINQCQNTPTRSNLNLNKGMGSPQIFEDIGKSSQSSVKESTQSGPSSLSDLFQGNLQSLQPHASRPLPRKYHRTSIPTRFLFQLAGQYQALYQISEFVSQPVLQIEEIFQADDQLTNCLEVYELMQEDEDPKENDLAKMYSIRQKRFDEPTSVVEELIKKSIWV